MDQSQGWGQPQGARTGLVAMAQEIWEWGCVPAAAGEESPKCRGNVDSEKWMSEDGVGTYNNRDSKVSK